MDNEVQAVEVQEVKEKPYKLRNLKSDDIFTCVTIINKIGFKEIKSVISLDKIKDLAQAKEGELNLEQVGYDIIVDIIGIILGNLECCKDSIYRLLSSLSGMSKQEIADLDIDVFVSMIMDIFKQDGFKDFIKVVSKYIK